jgi:hypothetical protein
MKNSEGFQVVEEEEKLAYTLLLSELKALRDNLVIFKKGFTEIPLGDQRVKCTAKSPSHHRIVTAYASTTFS